MSTPANGSFKTADEEAHDRLLADAAQRAPAPVEPVQNPAYPILAYCGASITMTLVNKFVVSGAHFDMNFLLLTIQSAVCVVAVYAARAAGVFTFRDFNMKDAKGWFPVSALLVTVIYSGSKSLQNLSIPAYTVLKNGAIILTAYGELVVFKSPLSRLTLCAFALMVISSLIAGWPELSKSLYGTATEVSKNTGAGYLWMGLNCVATAAYLLFMRGRIKMLGFKDLDSMMFNNLLSIPILVVASVLFEDWGSESLARNFPSEGRYFLLFSMAFSGAATVGISYTTAWCIRVTSSTTYSMVGALNKLPIAASGFIFFGDPATLCSVGSVIVGFGAGLIYSTAKVQQAAETRAKAASDIPLHNREVKN